MDDPEANGKFAASLDLDYPVLSDPQKNVARAYGVVTSERAYAQRWTFYIGTDGNILYIDKRVSPATHGEEVATRLEQLGVARRK